jgi:hypothetical protein
VVEEVLTSEIKAIVEEWEQNKDKWD